MTGSLIVRMARHVSAALISEVLYWMDKGGLRPYARREDDVLSLAWRDVNISLGKAMEDYPLEAATRDAAHK